MPRFDYDDYSLDPLAQGRWEHNLAVCATSKRGRAALRRVEAALAALPRPALITGRIATPEGDVCALGALVAAERAAAEGKTITEAAKSVAQDLAYIDDDDVWEWSNQTLGFARALGLTETLACLLGDLNDNTYSELSPEGRYAAVLAWVRRCLEKP
jgi:hypothetical protein